MVMLQIVILSMGPNVTYEKLNCLFYINVTALCVMVML